MAATLHTPPSQPPTPPTPYPAFRLPGGIDTPSISRNASTSSSKSTTTTSSTASLVAAPIRPPPIETSTAASSSIQLTGSRPSSSSGAPPHAFGAAYASGSGLGPDGTTYATPRGIYGGRGFMRNGPRSNRQGTLPLPVITTDRIPNRASSTPLPVPETNVQRLSPTTPRQHQFGQHAGPSSPKTPNHGMESRTGRTLGVGSASRDASSDRETRDRDRRQSQASSSKSSNGRPRETPKDYVFGEELGRGSYSTVVQAVKVQSTSSPTSPRPPKQYAIKIINQAHLIQEKKTKYAMIERDALVRLGTPRPHGTSSTAGHRRGMSGSGGVSGMPKSRMSTTSISSMAGSAPGSRRESMSTFGASGSGITGERGGGDRLSVNTALSDSGSSSTLGSSVPISPIMKSIPGRRPSRSADPPETLPEHPSAEPSPMDERGGPSSAGAVAIGKSRPPSPVKEDSREGTLDHLEELTPPRPRYFDEPRGSTEPRGTAPMGIANGGGGGGGGVTSGSATPEKRSSREEDRTPVGTPGSSKPRRNSHAPSERSVRSTRSSKSGKGMGPSHPGVIRLYSTFNDATSLYFVLDLASNGELLTFLRRLGSFDLASTRYYAAQVLDTVEWMHESGVIHRDLKPENILLNDDMRIKITDFGSAKILNKEQKDGNEVDLTGRKRSFVGSADFVSPEVLRNEAAVFASDIWAFGCILYQLITGKPPFRGATDYLTFQKILKREFDYPEGFDPEARDLVDSILNLDPASRPSPAEIKAHAFWGDLDWSSIWSITAPHISTGMTRPQTTLASLKPDNDIWAVFEDEVSDGGFGYDEEADDDDPRGSPDVPRPARSPPPPRTVPHGHSHRGSPLFDGGVAAEAVIAVDSSPLDDGDEEEELQPPSAPWAEGQGDRRGPAFQGSHIGAVGGASGETARKGRGWSRTSHRTSSSSSASRTALSGFLETMGITPPFAAGGSSRTSRTSVGSDATRPISRGSEKVAPAPLTVSTPGSTGERSPEASIRTANDDARRWSGILLAHEHVLFHSLVNIKSSALPSFLSAGGSKKRHLILTDFPRLLTVKEEQGAAAKSSAGSGTSTSPSPSPEPASFDLGGADAVDGANREGGEMAVKAECLFVVRPSSRSARSGQRNADENGSGGVSRGVVLDVVDKGAKGFVVQTSGQNYTYLCDSPELKNAWVAAIRKVYA